MRGVGEGAAAAFGLFPELFVEGRLGGLSVGGKCEIGYGVAFCEKHFLVEGLNGCHNIRKVFIISIDVYGRINYIVSSWLHDGLGVLVEETAVGLEVDDPAWSEELAVAADKAGGGEPPGRAFELGVRESEPYLGDLAGSEERLEKLYSGPQKGCVRDGILGHIFGAFPEAGALDVHADEILLREAAGEGDSVVAFAAAELEYYGIGVTENICAPAPLEGVVAKVKAGLAGAEQHLCGGGLLEAREGLVLGEFSQFVVAHLT